MEAKHNSIGDLDRIGARLYSRWTSARSGRELVIVNRGWHRPGAKDSMGMFLTMLDLLAEQAHDVAADDFVRWFNDKRILKR